MSDPDWESIYREGEPEPSPRAALAWHIGDDALEQLANECAALGLDEQQSYRLWKITADAFNQMYRAGVWS